MPPNATTKPSSSHPERPWFEPHRAAVLARAEQGTGEVLLKPSYFALEGPTATVSQLPPAPSGSPGVGPLGVLRHEQPIQFPFRVKASSNPVRHVPLIESVAGNLLGDEMIVREQLP